MNHDDSIEFFTTIIKYLNFILPVPNFNYPHFKTLVVVVGSTMHVLGFMIVRVTCIVLVMNFSVCELVILLD